ncbi:MAG: hypothetical protein GY835_07805 [bacterium]|nr:hypothetical protein [bacterium]
MTGTTQSPNITRIPLIITLILLGLAGSFPTNTMAEINSEIFCEDFSTLDFCDQWNTTALWDTEAAELRLHPYPMSTKSTIGLAGLACNFARSGDYVFLSDMDFGLQVLDISDIDNMEIVGGLPSVMTPQGMCVDGDYLYLTAHDRLLILDITDPTTPVIIGECDAVTQVSGVAIDGDRAYLASCDAGLYCLDISDRTAPILISQTATPTCAQAVTLYGEHAYVCTGYTGIAVFDIGNPALPVHVNQIPCSYHPERVRIAGGLAFVSEISGELLIYSLEDPAAPALLGACDLPGHAKGLDVSGNLVYLAIYDSETSMLCAVDVSDPSAPRLRGQAELIGFPIGVEIFGELALVNSGTDFLAVRIADPIAPIPTDPMPGSLHFNLVIDGSIAYIQSYSGEHLQAVSLVDPEHPEIIGGNSDVSGVAHMALAPPYIYLNSQNGLAVMDISDPTDPQVVGSCDLGGHCRSIEVYGDYLYYAYYDIGTGLFVVDIADPENPLFLYQLPLSNSPKDMVRNGDYLFVLDWEDGAKGEDSAPRNDRNMSDITVLDISNPALPVPAVTFTVTDAFVYQLEIDGDLLYSNFWSYLGVYGYGFDIYDISDPLDPQHLTRWANGDEYGELVLLGDRVYRSGGRQIDVIDVSDPLTPIDLHSIPTDRETRWLGVAGDYLFGSGGYAGLRSFRVFDRSVDAMSNIAQSTNLPAALTPLSHVRMQATSSNTIRWKFSADAGANWQWLPLNGDWLALEHPGAEPRWQAQLIYKHSGEEPVVTDLTLEWINDPTAIVDGNAPAIFALQRAVPNPFNPTTTISFDLPHECLARVDIYDMSGRHVRQLVNMELPAGNHHVIWDGCNDSGAPLGSGIYACRMSAAGFSQSRKLTLVK